MQIFFLGAYPVKKKSLNGYKYGPTAYVLLMFIKPYRGLRY